MLTTLDKWGNEWAADNANSFKVQIPSDIKPGTYILRTELIALHGNMKNLRNGPLAGIQFYPHCFNIDIIGTGTASPEGVTFPGAYKPTDPSFTFQPFMTYGPESGTEANTGYVSPPRRSDAGIVANSAPSPCRARPSTTGSTTRPQERHLSSPRRARTRRSWS
jgi:hypothetical protein